MDHDGDIFGAAFDESGPGPRRGWRIEAYYGMGVHPAYRCDEDGSRLLEITSSGEGMYLKCPQCKMRLPMRMERIDQ